jgi:hypothetical protein
MNERIEELAEQCYEDNSTQIDVYKFAELIVKECAQVAYHYTDGSENYQHYNDIGWDCLPGHLFHHIREHFGVENERTR